MLSKQNLKHKVVHGIKWAGVSRGSQQALQFMITVILARLLAPDDFGVMAMAAVFTGFVGLFSEFGIGSAVIQKQDLSNEDLSSIFWFNLLIGFSAMVLTIAISPLVAAFYGKNILTPVLSLSSIGFLLGGFMSLQYSILSKNMQFKKIAQVDVASLLVGGGVAIFMAWRGYGVYSLVGQGITSGVTRLALIWSTMDWKPKFTFQLGRVKALIGFGMNLMGFNLVNHIARNIDTLLIGKYLGAELLGYYTMAYRLMLSPLQNISHVVSRVLFPAFSMLQDDPLRLRNAYIKSTRNIVFITFPMMFGLFAVADEYISVVYGAKWIPAVFVFKVLCFVGMLQSIGTTVGQIYMAKGRTDWMFRWGVFATIVTTIAVIIGIRWGIDGVAIAYVTSNVLMFYVSLYIPFKLIDLRVWDLAVSIKKELSIALLMFLGVFSSVSLQRYFGVAPAILLISNVLLGIGLYLVLSRKLNKMFFYEIRSTVWSR